MATCTFCPCPTAAPMPWSAAWRSRMSPIWRLWWPSSPASCGPADTRPRRRQGQRSDAARPRCFRNCMTCTDQAGASWLAARSPPAGPGRSPGTRPARSAVTRLALPEARDADPQAGKTCRSRTAISFSTSGTGRGSSTPKRNAPDEAEYPWSSSLSWGKTEPL
jgi:hypothetical protein